MSYQFTMNDQNKIIFKNALVEAKKLLDAAKETFHSHQKFAPEDDSGEETLAESFEFFQILYDWLSLLQNQDSISLTKKNFLDFKKNYLGFNKYIDIFLNSFEEITIIATLKSPKNLTQQAMLTYHYNAQTSKDKNKENGLSLETKILIENKMSPK